MADLVAWVVRRRVAIGFAVGAAVLLLAEPTWPAWRVGLMMAAAGEAVRVWAAGHLEKGREVTRSGPYRLTRHPLYVGSTIIALGVVIASSSTMVAVLAALYIGATIPAAIRSEEAYLTRTFGQTYDRYRESRSEPVARRFSFERAWRNREYRAVAGLLAGFALLAARILYN
jgi:protein-S-isoprenylcysteine O-methyltransferase Ste14